MHSKDRLRKLENKRKVEEGMTIDKRRTTIGRRLTRDTTHGYGIDSCRCRRHAQQRWQQLSEETLHPNHGHETYEHTLNSDWVRMRLTQKVKGTEKIFLLYQRNQESFKEERKEGKNSRKDSPWHGCSIVTPWIRQHTEDAPATV